MCCLTFNVTGISNVPAVLPTVVSDTLFPSTFFQVKVIVKVTFPLASVNFCTPGKASVEGVPETDPPVTSVFASTELALSPKIFAIALSSTIASKSTATSVPVKSTSTLDTAVTDGAILPATTLLFSCTVNFKICPYVISASPCFNDTAHLATLASAFAPTEVVYLAYVPDMKYKHIANIISTAIIVFTVLFVMIFTSFFFIFNI